MSNRATLHLKHKITLDHNHGCFNWQSCELFRFFHENEVFPYALYDEEGRHAQWTISDNELRDLVERLKTLPEEELNPFMFDDIQYANEELISIFENWIEQTYKSDHRDIYITWI